MRGRGRRRRGGEEREEEEVVEGEMRKMGRQSNETEKTGNKRSTVERRMRKWRTLETKKI